MTASLSGSATTLNFKHRKIRLAGRASIEHYVGQSLKARGKKTHTLPIEVDGARGTGYGAYEYGSSDRASGSGGTCTVHCYGLLGLG